MFFIYQQVQKPSERLRCVDIFHSIEASSQYDKGMRSTSPVFVIKVTQLMSL